MEDIFSTSYYKSLRTIWSGIYNVAGQIMSYLLCDDVTREAIDLHIAKLFDTEADVERLSKMYSFQIHLCANGDIEKR